MWPDDETPEPAAWINFNAATGGRNVSFVCESELASIPLWSEPPRPQRKPLSAIDLRALYDRHAACQEEGPETSGWWDFARAIERAHGIGGEE